MTGQTVRMKLSKGGARTQRTAAAVFAALLFLVGTTAGSQAALTKAGTGTLIIGVVPGQTLRVSVPNPSAAGDFNGDGRADIADITAAVVLFDNTGRMIYETPEVNIPAGGFHSFDVGRADIPAAGEPRTGHVEVRVELVIKVAPGRGESECSAGGLTKVGQGILQVINNDTGETRIALLLPAVQKVREAARR